MAVDTQLTTFSETDLAWAAGFIDGEGSIGLYRGKHPTSEFYVLRLSVTNTDIRALERLKKMFGGSINKSNHKSRPTRRPCWAWYCQCAKGAAALEMLLPYLLVKKERAEIALLSRRYLRRKGQFRLTSVQIDGQRAVVRRLAIVR